MDPSGSVWGSAVAAQGFAAAFAVAVALGGGVGWTLWRRLRRLQARLRRMSDTLPAGVPEATAATAAEAATGLVPRARFEQALEAAEHRAPPGPAGLCVLVIDVDGFSAVNDALGHAQADSVLLALARRLVALTPDRLALSRLGGDEFVLALECPLARA